ncbi:unnamed protein product [Effrenium voratum]|nr:unnamed protein product [Effrenium voratum]
MEDLFARAERAAFMYYVIGGSLQYHMLRPHPRRSNTAAIQVQPGEWVSEGALWFENWVHFGWLRAKTACEFLLVNVEVFQAVAMKSPSPYLGSTIYKQAWVKRIKEDVRKQEDGVTRLLLGRPSDLSGDRQIAEHIAADAFPDLAKKYDRLLHPSLAPFRSFSSSRTAVAG